MLKRYLIISLLFLAYTIVFAHGIVPHDHNRHNSELNHHFIDNCAEDDADEDESDLAHSFEHYLHAGSTPEMYLKDASLHIDYNLVSSHFITAIIDFSFSLAEEEKTIPPSENADLPLSVYCLSSKALRAPPLL